MWIIGGIIGALIILSILLYFLSGPTYSSKRPKRDYEDDHIHSQGKAARKVANQSAISRIFKR